MSGFAWTTRIEVTDHARQRARELLAWNDPQHVSGEVRSALLEGRIAECVPNWTRGNGRVGRTTDGVRYVWNPEATRCWVVTTQEGAVFVMTLLLDHETETDAAENRLVRNGMTRRP